MNSRHSSSNDKLAAAAVKLETAAAPTCALCNCGDKCLLGQGDLLRFDAADAAVLLSAAKLVQQRLQQQQQTGAGNRAENEKFIADCLVGYLESASAAADDYLALYLNKNGNLGNLFK